MPDADSADAAGDDHVGDELPDQGTAGQPAEIGLVAHADHLDRNAAAAQRLEERAAGVERDHPGVEPEATQPRREDRQLALGPARA